MELKIGKKDYEIYMGIAALKYLDNVYVLTEETSGLQFGVGLEMLTSGLSMGNILALVNFIKAGTVTERSKPSDKEIEAFLGTMTVEELERFFEEVKEELKKQPLTRIKANQILSAMKQPKKTTEKE